MAVETKDRLIAAAGAVLRAQGYAKASARAIAKEAGVNSALVFYHFGGVDQLLFAALDRSSAERMARHTATVAEARTVEDLAEAATRIYRDDLEGGHITLLSELVAAAVARPELREGIRVRVEPWMAFVEETLERVVGGTPLARLTRRATWRAPRSPSTWGSTSSPCWTPTAPGRSRSSRWCGGWPPARGCSPCAGPAAGRGAGRRPGAPHP
ncbi:TetR/AcrR family transcriptional regulator [Streptomyces cinnamoneus]|uniref:TetR/AcrR family transcriptional regulator n=1 Tax=Streptomyces cinnamoneus TaxID=53446 RepID=UPI00195F7D2C|nr:TetR/AcrR family transcriptional regulator [Streptomyces cinnamoneus]